MKLAFGCDPNAAELKKALIAKAESLGHEVTDFGSEDPIYANVAADVAHAVADKKYDRGVVVCGTGIGVSLAANKVKGAYCALLADPYSAQRATLSNNANMVAMGAQTTGIETAKVLLEIYLSNTFDPNSRSGAKVARVCEIEAEAL
ncbi:RpiB/LacA/LacB family sugar-phosphate isomerase [Propionimicrobium sp. PCR01-08-3]|uniref:RpiB/LacA/LacB family sugar-phosphate isomerase n=1 Tax=Propionimicrobium sp. PCR01-08-3 TaxID=3052086 RepID=UPI00255C8E62|nr:RpiB/LacA/LacB family sugar-phosphate isomerase [Propionimicrobium sp. PCR01-08-3]WIY83764.1 RpiB/LacA/LacB family sugar-phosphate isomerase [Propionimicrobium sp. PCR01-08-3]